MVAKIAPLVLVGNPAIWHVGRHLRVAAEMLALPVRICDSSAAFRSNPVFTKFNWWLRGHRPTHLAGFSRAVERACRESGAGYLLTTGLAPVDAGTLRSIGGAGVLRMNFLTDDPWNPQHTAGWFMRALPHYDIVFTPRRANVEDLRRAGCATVRYLPFGYAPDIHFPEPPAGAEEQKLYSADVFFAGGADADRVPYLTALIQADMTVGLYGAYWNRYPETRTSDRGSASHDVLRKAAAGARIALCLVRRANRDGHAMRTFELAASGACILAEDTQEHREILGPEGVSAVYFSSIPEMIAKARALLADD
ncbi:MAG: glycosyltransferase, partial [Acidobacteriota bacterium]|nr:glycosyltransferase [Acidobacteriota bacterium]